MLIEVSIVFILKTAAAYDGFECCQTGDSPPVERDNSSARLDIGEAATRILLPLNK
jgi:hypothetical protein